jgi:U3 small nucleolar RNA-associated protein 14
MPSRVARANTSSQPKAARQKNKKRSLDAYAQAQRLVPEKRIPQHRLGEIEDDGSRPKRRRPRVDEEEDEDEENQPRRKKPAQRRPGDGDDGPEYGSDSDGNEWTMGGLAEDDDDSDLDSEEAFGESDNEKFEGFTFRGSKSGKLKGKKKSLGRTPNRRDIDADVDLDEREESEDDSGDSQDEEGLGFGDDAIDLAAMLDDDEGDDKVSAAKKDDQESGSEDEDDEDTESESDFESEDQDDDADDEERVARLRDRLEALDADRGGRKPPTTDDKTTVDLKDAFAEFEDSFEPKKSGKKSKKEAKITTIAAPLPKRQQDRMDREVATAKAKEQLDRWRDTVIRNRRAEFLEFPMRHPDDQGATIGRDKFQSATQQAPANELEESIQRIMQESGLAKKPENEGEVAEDEETALLKAEELAEKSLPVEEVMRRRAELRKARALLFREEIKAKRIAKIKSKSYRRVHRRERERLAEQEREALEGLGVDGMDEDEKEKHDRQRAQARMATKHKESKWAKSLKQTNRTAWDDETRDGVIEQARRNEELKKRMAGKDLSDDEDGSFHTDSDGDGEITAHQLDSLQKDDGEKKGLAGLKFMRAAEERRRKANDEDVDRLRRELAVADGDEVQSEAEDEELGRAIFGPASKEAKRPVKQRSEFEAPESSDDDAEIGLESEGAATATGQKSAQQHKQAQNLSSKKSMTASGPLAKGSSQRDNKDDSSKSGMKGWLSHKSKDTHADIDVPLMPVAPAGIRNEADSTKPAKKKQKDLSSHNDASNTEGWTTIAYKGKENDDSDSDAEETSTPILSAKEQKQTLQQQAFAGDDVELAFEAEKAELAASEDEKEVSNHLPGWGSWTGDGLSKSIRKANKKAAHNPLFKTKLAGVKQADRRDAKLDRVIVSEKNDRKGKKYLAPVLPHEFETKEQYERSRRLPMGPEWTTKVTHQKMTRPRVVVKPGVNLSALEKPLV